MEDKTMKNKYLSVGVIIIGIIAFVPINYLSAQDDIYYMPSKTTSTKPLKAAVSVDTSGMTDYEKYRAMKEAQGDQSNNINSDSVNSEYETSSKAFDSTSTITLNPAYVIVDNDTTQGSVTINNYYLSDDNNYDPYRSYRNLYFDYYSSPYYYDPFCWDFSYGYGGPYFGFHYGWGSPYYYGYYGYNDFYWYRPYWYSPYSYNTYWDGYYSGYYSSNFNNNYRRGDVYNSGGRRMGGYRSVSAAGGSTYYGGRFSGPDTYHGTRRGTGITPVSTTRSTPSSNVRRQTSWDSYSGVSSSTVRRSANVRNQSVATTKPYDGSTIRRAGYTPSYSISGTHSRSNYNNSGSEVTRRQSSSVNNYVVTPNSGTVRRSAGSNSNYVPSRSENSDATASPAPRRSGDSYSPPVRTSSQRSGDEGATRRSSSSNSTPSYNSGSSNSSSSSGNSGGSGNRGGNSGRRR